MRSVLDTNVIVRFLVEEPGSIPAKFRGVFTFFPKLETGEVAAELPALMVFEAFFVLTSYYEVPPAEAASRLADIVGFRGVIMGEKRVIARSLKILQDRNIGLVDAYIVALSEATGVKTVYSFDAGLAKYGLELLDVK
ncbi:MAG: hypothetical protein A3K19_24895 [Lentisphaerae bacterium RIFOXYB12_FULL_65_16]|nr:MAG: hypothetical protein A3K18_24825 [Lentisphaerae bacterium RIFOXYA12_64_32]OGV90708.1 MAG: hypothetical protein A3K19_24895 [Lentisphaerae bacterium RIFOXYB12_FULL_65_16]